MAYDARDQMHIPDLVIMMADYMRELKMVRHEVEELRFKHLPDVPALQALIKDTGLKIYQQKDGKWAFNFPYHQVSSGGQMRGTDTMIDAFRAAIKHMVYMLKRDVDGDDEEDY